MPAQDAWRSLFLAPPWLHPPRSLLLSFHSICHLTSTNLDCGVHQDISHFSLFFSSHQSILRILAPIASRHSPHQFSSHSTMDLPFSFMTMPNELVALFVSVANNEDLPALRLASRALNIATTSHFARVYFTNLDVIKSLCSYKL